MLSPAVLLGRPFPSPASESDLLDDVERCELFLLSLGVLASRSFKLNLPGVSPLSECADDDFLRTGVTGTGAGGWLPRLSRAIATGGGVTRPVILPPETPADMLGALLAGWLGGLLGPLLGGALGPSQ